MNKLQKANFIATTITSTIMVIMIWIETRMVFLTAFCLIVLIHIDFSYLYKCEREIFDRHLIDIVESHNKLFKKIFNHAD